MTSCSSSLNLYGFGVAPLCVLDLNSPLAAILFVEAKILLSTTKVLTSPSTCIYSCINTSASCFHNACIVETKLSILSILITPIPCVPVSVLSIIGNLLPTNFTASSMFFSLDTNAVLGVGIPYFSNNSAEVNLLSQVSIAALVFNINEDEF